MKEKLKEEIREIVKYEILLSIGRQLKRCEKCRCLIYEKDVIKIENLKKHCFDYYCGRCKPEYDKIDENGKKFKMIEIK